MSQDNDDFELGSNAGKTGGNANSNESERRNDDEERDRTRDDRRNDRRNDNDRDNDRYDEDDDRNDRRNRRKRTGPTIADFGRSINVRPTSGGLGDVALQRLIKAFDANKSFNKPGVADAVKRDRFKIAPLDGALAKSNLSSILVCLPTTVGSQSFNLVYVLTVEPAGGVQTRQSNDRGDSYDALILPEDQLAKKSYKDAINKVAATVGSGSVAIVGKQVLLASVVANLSDDVDNKQPSPVVDAIFDNVLDAICGVRDNIVDRVQGKRNTDARLNPDMVDRSDRLEISWDLSGKPGEDSSGLPIRSDIAGSLYYSEAGWDSNDRDRDGDDVPERTPMGEIRAGLDLVLCANDRDDDRRRRGGGRRRHRDDIEPIWQGVLNINSLAPIGNFPFSLELAQLLIAQVAVQSNDYRWSAPLRPRSSIGAPDGRGTMATISDIKNLMLVHPDQDIAKVYDDVSQNMTDDEFLRYLDITVKPDLAFGLTIPSSGEKSWVLSIYERIATSKDRDEVKRLVKTLFDSADVLTGNRFRRVWKDLTGKDSDTRLPVDTMNTRQLIGTWVDDKGNVRDLREWNVPAVLTSYGEKNPRAAEEFQYTYEDRYHCLGYNISERVRMLSKIVPGLRVVDTAEMMALDPDYVEALAISIDEAGMSSYQASSEGLNARRRTGNDRYSSMATSDIGRSRGRGRERGRDRDSGGLFGDAY